MATPRKGSIFSLRPDAAFYAVPSETVLSAATRMSNSRVHCVLVKEDGGDLLGLFTSKDLAYRVVALGLDPSVASVGEIMTRDPLCLHMDTPITEALEIMVKRGVRHLPLLDDEGGIKGVIDITRCFHQAMLRLERISYNAKRLGEVLKDVEENYEDVRSLDAERILEDVKKLGEVIDIPTLESVDCKPPVFVDSTADVLTAAKLMVDHSTTALLVVDGTSSSKKVIGIFTSKDISFRVLAKGYDPAKCTVARVLTSSPEFAKSNVTVSAALRLMYQGHFLNLPVMDEHTNEIIGVVSVLQLTYTALAQLGKGAEFNGGSLQQSTLEEVTHRLGQDQTPVWDKFWDSLERSTEDMHTLESSVSRSPKMSRAGTPHQPDSRRSSINQLLSSSRRSSSLNARRFSEESNSSTVHIQRIPSTESLTRMSFYLKRKTIVFKINHPSMQHTHKISMTLNNGVSIYDDLKLFELLRQEIASKLELEDLKDYEMYYHDDEGDLVLIDDEDGLVEAINTFEKRPEFNAVELVLRPRETPGMLASLWAFVHATWMLVRRRAESKAGLMAGTLTVLSIGVLVGYSFSRR